MLTLSSLFVLLLRLTLFCQGQVEGLSNLGSFIFFETQTVHSEASQLQPILISFESSGSLTATLETEERAEVETEDSDFSILSVYSFHEFVRNKGGFLFSIKTFRVSRLPLYDIFHSWRIHLP
jgi:hypothetical protein